LRLCFFFFFLSHLWGARVFFFFFFGEGKFRDPFSDIIEHRYSYLHGTLCMAEANSLTVNRQT